MQTPTEYGHEKGQSTGMSPVSNCIQERSAMRKNDKRVWEIHRDAFHKVSGDKIKAAWIAKFTDFLTTSAEKDSPKNGVLSTARSCLWRFSSWSFSLQKCKHHKEEGFLHTRARAEYPCARRYIEYESDFWSPEASPEVQRPGHGI